MKQNKVQKSLDSYCVASQHVILVNSVQGGNTDTDVDLEAVINNEGTEWVNMEVDTTDQLQDAAQGTT